MVELRSPDYYSVRFGFSFAFFLSRLVSHGCSLLACLTHSTHRYREQGQFISKLNNVITSSLTNHNIVFC